MVLQYPFTITSRLMAGVRVGDATLSISYSLRPGREGRTRYQWFWDGPDDQEESGDDIQSGCGGGSIREGMSSLLSFLSACGESYRYKGDEGENSDLFPATMREWCENHCDDLAMTQLEINEDATCCVE